MNRCKLLDCCPDDPLSGPVQLIKVDHLQHFPFRALASVISVLSVVR
jgi:hypothetical protein